MTTDSVSSELEEILQGSTLRKKPWGELVPDFSDLVTSKSISISEKPVKKIWSHW